MTDESDRKAYEAMDTGRKQHIHRQALSLLGQLSGNFDEDVAVIARVKFLLELVSVVSIEPASNEPPG